MIAGFSELQLEDLVTRTVAVAESIGGQDE